MWIELPKLLLKLALIDDDINRFCGSFGTAFTVKPVVIESLKTWGTVNRQVPECQYPVRIVMKSELAKSQVEPHLLQPLLRLVKMGSDRVAN